MFKHLIPTLLCIPLLLSALKNSEIETFDKIVQQCLTEFQIPSIAVGVLMDGKPVLVKAYGYRDLEKKSPANQDTIYPIGSCTKGFTSCLIGTFIDEGRLEWDDLLTDLLPNLRLWDDHTTRHLTLRDLLSHRSGLPRHEWFWYNSSLARDDLIQRLRYLEPVCGMREQFYYNSWLYCLAGSVLESISGKSWEQLMQERILTPLQMKRTNFSVAISQKDSNIAYPYLNKGTQIKKLPFRDLTLVGPGGSINSTVSDMLHWMDMLLNRGNYQGKSIISSATWQEICTPQMVTSAPAIKEVMIPTYGLGWYVQSYRGHLNLIHDGVTDGFTSGATLLPKENIAIIVFCNRNITPVLRLLSYYLCDILLGLPPIDPITEARAQSQTASQDEGTDPLLSRKDGTAPSHDWSEFPGNYIHPAYGTITVEKHNGDLLATFNNITYTLSHWHYDTFVVSAESQDKIVSNIGTKFTFRTNLNGDIDELLVPFEPSVTDVPFKKQVKDPLAYLNQFTGSYQIYHYTVEIALRSQTLCALIPGQPVYELIPAGDNEFKVKALIGYTVRFIKDNLNKVKEVVLIQPYGTFTAKRQTE